MWAHKLSVIGWLLCLAYVLRLTGPGVALSEQWGAAKSRPGNLTEEHDRSWSSRHAETPALGYPTFHPLPGVGKYCAPTAIHLSRTYTVVAPGLTPGYVYYREDAWVGTCYGVPIGCCCPHVVGYRYFWYRPSVTYFDPAAPLLRDLAAVTNRYVGTSRVRSVQDLTGFESNQRAAAPQQNDIQPDFKQNVPRPSVVEPIKFRPSNEQQRDLASRFMSFGDRCFAEGQYRDAYFRYKEAEKAAPDLPESLFRQGFALLATKQYELAFQAFRRGLRMDPSWPKKPFSLVRFYNNRQLDLREHLAALAAECEKKNHDPTLAFLLGIMLFRCDRADDAKGFFEIARSTPSSGELAVLFSENGH